MGAVLPHFFLFLAASRMVLPKYLVLDFPGRSGQVPVAARAACTVIQEQNAYKVIQGRSQ